MKAYLKKLHDANIHPNIVSFGGTVVVPDAVVQNVENILNGVAQATELKMTSTWTPDPVANLKAFHNELGLYQDGQMRDSLLVSENNPNNALITVDSSRANDGEEVSIVFYAWDSNAKPVYHEIKPIAKELFKFYSPTGYNQLYSMADASFSGSYAYGGKVYTFDDREFGIRIDDSQNAYAVYVSKPGEKLPPLKGVNY